MGEEDDLIAWSYAIVDACMKTGISINDVVKACDEWMRKMIEIAESNHDISMQSISKPNAKRKMVKAVCERCKQESDWHYSDKAAKRELENKPCK